MSEEEMTHLAAFHLRRLALAAVGATVAVLWAMSPIGTSAAGVPGEQCATNTNSATGQMIQVCANWDGIADSDGATEAVSCYAISMTASVQTSVSCTATGNADGSKIQPPNVTVPGDAAATAAEGSLAIQPLTVCVTGVATDVNNNNVSIATCFS